MYNKYNYSVAIHHVDLSSSRSLDSPLAKTFFFIVRNRPSDSNNSSVYVAAVDAVSLLAGSGLSHVG